MRFDLGLQRRDWTLVFAFDTPGITRINSDISSSGRTSMGDKELHLGDRKQAVRFRQKLVS
jgi:hypothetical protein